MKILQFLVVVCFCQLAIFHAASGATCATIRCKAGYKCVDKPIVCIKAPCDPIGECVPTEKPGLCSRVLWKRPCLEKRKDQCEIDYDCKGCMKCCFNGCYNMCMTPIYIKGK